MMKREESSNDFEKLQNYHNHQKEKTKHIKKLKICFANFLHHGKFSLQRMNIFQYYSVYKTIEQQINKKINILDFSLPSSCPIDENCSPSQVREILKKKIQKRDKNKILSEESIENALSYVEKNHYIDPNDVLKKIDHLKVETAPMSDKLVLGVAYYSYCPFKANLIVIQEGLSKELLTSTTAHEQIHIYSEKVPILEEPITSYFNSFLTHDNLYHTETTMLRMLIEVVGIDPILKADAIGSLEPIENELYKLNPNKDTSKALFQTFQDYREAEDKIDVQRIMASVTKFLSILDDYYQKKHDTSIYQNELMKAYIIQLNATSLVVYKDYLYGTGTYFTFNDNYYPESELFDLIDQNLDKIVLYKSYQKKI